MESDLRAELLAMVREADDLHTALSRSGEIYRGYPASLAEANGRHGRRLEEVLRASGWPGRSRVGEDGAEAAWRIAIHAIGLPSLQRMALDHLRAAVAAGEAPAAQAAFLEDKIAFMESRPQRYGTQFDWDERGEMSPWTLAEPEGVDELRRGVGLGTLAQRTAEMRAGAGGDDAPPADWHARRREFEAWARSVGWR